MGRTLFGQSDIFRNTAILIGGTGIAQAIPFLLQPLLRRIYSPEEFGAFALYFSMIWILTDIANFRYDLAVNLPEKDKEAAHVLILSFAVNFLFNVVLLLVILFFGREIGRFFKFPERFSGFLYILPLSTFLFCTAQSINYWLIRKKAFRSLSVNKVSRRAAEGTVQVFFGMLRLPSGLFWADLAGNIANNISGIFQLKRSGFTYPHFSRAELLQVMRKYSHFPKFNLLPTLLGTLAMQFPVFIINKLFTKTELGFFDLTQQAIMAPFALITVAVSQVLLQVVTKKRQNRESMSAEFFRLSALLLVIGLVSLIIIELWGVPLFSLVFGIKWALAGSYARILVIGYMFFLVVSPMNAFLQGLEEMRLMSFWNIAHFILMGSLLFLTNIGFETFIMVYAGLETIVFSILFFAVFKAIRRYESSISKG
jgi:O-antigen/teichoic acid export membrane protein